MRARYVVSVVVIIFDAFSAIVITVMYVILWETRPRYNGTWRYMVQDQVECRTTEKYRIAKKTPYIILFEIKKKVVKNTFSVWLSTKTFRGVCGHIVQKISQTEGPQSFNMSVQYSLLRVIVSSWKAYKIVCGVCSRCVWNIKPVVSCK